jgi:hypothetical protein
MHPLLKSKDKMTTKLDILRDILTDALINLDLMFGYDDDGEFISEARQEYEIEEAVKDMLSVVDIYDSTAEPDDFKIRVVK